MYRELGEYFMGLRMSIHFDVHHATYCPNAILLQNSLGYACLSNLKYISMYKIHIINLYKK
jgi:superoxide dismutase